MRVLLARPRPSTAVVDLALALAERGDDVAILTERPVTALTHAGVRQVPMAPAQPPAAPGGHRYLRELDRAVRTGQRAYRAARHLVAEGYAPDVVLGDADEGATLYLPELFPTARLVCEVTWYHRPRGSDGDFFPARPLDADNACHRRARQRRRAPPARSVRPGDRGLGVAVGPAPPRRPGGAQPGAHRCRHHVLVAPPAREAPEEPGWRPPVEGIAAGSRGRTGSTCERRGADGLVTFVADSLDPYRGIEPFLRAVALLLERRAGTRVVVVGRDDVPGAWPAPDAGGSWPRSLMARLGLDRSNVHVVGPLPDRQRRDLLRHSCVHVHLNAPFVPGADLLEAMATGALVVGSRTPPVEEVVAHGRNGLLVPFDDPEALAAGAGAPRSPRPAPTTSCAAPPAGTWCVATTGATAWRRWAACSTTW